MPDLGLPEFSILKVSIDEMIVKLLEAYWETPRPPGLPTQEIIDNLDKEEFDRLRRMALVAIDYLITCHIDAVGEEHIRVMRPGDPRH